MTKLTEPMNTPWQVRHDEDDYWCVVDAAGRVLFAQTGPGAEETARFIAIAPDMRWLAERARTLRNAEGWKKEDRDNSWAHWDAEFNRAIAAATGKGAQSVNRHAVELPEAERLRRVISHVLDLLDDSPITAIRLLKAEVDGRTA